MVKRIVWLTSLLVLALAMSAWAIGDPNNPNVLLKEDFSASSADEFLSASYKALPGQPGEALYVFTGGNALTIENGVLTIAGGRFAIGMPASQVGVDTAEGVPPVGTLDLSRPYRILVEVVEVFQHEPTGNNRFQIYVDNNTVNAGRSFHGGSSRILQQDISGISPGQTLVVESSTGTPNSFLQIRAESGAGVKIKSIVIEYR